MKKYNKIGQHRISTLSLLEHTKIILDKIDSAEGFWVVTFNLEMLARGLKNEEYNSIVKSADITIADGVPLLWHSKMSGYPIAGRSNGTDLVESIFKSDKPLKIGIIGGCNNIERTKKVNIIHQIVFSIEGEITSSEQNLEEFDRVISKSNVNIIFVALGVPKQDQVCKLIREKHNVVVVGVGGALDLLSGEKNRAPIFMQRHGLEWLHRLLNEPSRLWRRYILLYPIAIPYLLKSAMCNSLYRRRGINR